MKKMPCIYELFLRNRKCHRHTNQSTDNDASQYLLNPSQSADTNSKRDDPSSVRPSSVEVANLRAQLWSISADLSESVSCAHNLQDIVTAAVQEKYELIDQLSESQVASSDMKTQLFVERELHATERKDLLNEIVFLKGQLDDRSQMFEKVTNQNIELKLQLYEANETIARMGEMFLKMKLTKDAVASK